jgi:hypothetical protein
MTRAPWLELHLGPGHNHGCFLSGMPYTGALTPVKVERVR